MQAGPVAYRRPSPRHRPISPPVERGPRGQALPAYVSNGLIGLRVRENPLRAGLCLVNGFSGEHHERRIEAAAVAPYPLGGDLCLDGVWMSDQPESVRLVDQAYDFETAELTSRLVFAAEGKAARVEVVTFASRTHPTIVCQQVAIEADPGSEIVFRARIDPEGVRGRQLRRRTATPGEPEPVCDGSILWSSEGEMNTCGLAMLTAGPEAAERSQAPWDEQGPLATSYRIAAGQGRRVFTQLVCLVPSRTHTDPDNQAVRLVAQAGAVGFDDIRRRNRAEWARLWTSRIRLVGAERRWQALADAAFFYLTTSVHPSSPASTSIFGMATWHDYHYYFGHVMWDIDAFAAPCLSLLQPGAADALLDFRSRGIPTARENARFYGRVGLQFPWEASPRNGEETAPGGGDAAHREIHVSLHVARAFALHADAAGDERFLRERAWPVLAGVSDFIADRVSPIDGGYGFRELGGIAERAEMVDNDAVTILVARIILERALEAAQQLGAPEPPRWREVAEGLRPPVRADGVIASHEGYRSDEEKGDTPEPLMAIFPYWAPVEEATRQKTLAFYLSLWRGYVGSPMLAALYGAWAAWSGDRALSLKLLEEGYGAYEYGRFSQTLEYRRDKFEDQTPAGPFIANIGGFLTSLLFGFPGLRPGAGPLSEWPRRTVMLPQGWTAIECDRLWLRGGAVRLVARQGDDSMPDLSPMEARSAEALPEGEGWWYEPKWDGFRCLAERRAGEVTLTAKSGKPLDRYFPEVVQDLEELGGGDFLLDGELLIHPGGFKALQDRLHPAASRIARLARETPARLTVFDMPGPEPLSERRAALEAFVERQGRGHLDLTPGTSDLATAQAWLSGGDYEGVIAKRLEEPYRPGERAMVKVKRIRTADCVVGGFRYAKDGKLVGSLLLGLYDAAGRLDHVGFTSGLKAVDKVDLTRRLEALRGGPGFTGDAPGGPSRWQTEASARWEPLKPELVVEVSFDHVTDGRFRHGTRLIRFRPDKAPAQCTKAQIA